MSDKYGIYLQRKTPELVGTLWLNHIKGKLSSAFTYATEWLQAPHKFALSPARGFSSAFRTARLTVGAKCS